MKKEESEDHSESYNSIWIKRVHFCLLRFSRTLRLFSPGEDGSWTRRKSADPVKPYFKAAFSNSLLSSNGSDSKGRAAPVALLGS